MRYGWLASKNRKRHQRVMNDLIRKINQNIKNDDLWRGRFYIRQIAAQWYEYEDKSGAELLVILRFIDKKTGFYWATAETVNHWRWGNGGRLALAMNDFIVKRTKVWESDPMPGSPEWFDNINW